MRVPRSLSMTRRTEFAAVRKKGQSHGCRNFLMATLVHGEIEHVKIGLITSRRVGNAVKRNRIRRRLRSILSKYGDRIESGRYLVMVARPGASESTFQQLERDWLRLADRLGILKNG